MNTLNYINDKLNERYNILIKLLNKLLESMGEKQIVEATEFKDIARKKLLNKKNIEVYEEMADEIHKYYSKDQLRHGQRAYIKHYIIVVIRKMCEFVFLNFKSTTIQNKEGKKKVTYVYYSIVKQE